MLRFRCVGTLFTAAVVIILGRVVVVIKGGKNAGVASLVRTVLNVEP
jgi:hypothetical protein